MKEWRRCVLLLGGIVTAATVPLKVLDVSLADIGEPLLLQAINNDRETR